MVKLSEPQQLQRSLIAKKKSAVMTRTSLGVFLLLAMAHCFCALGFCSPHRVHGPCSRAHTAFAGWAFVSLTARMDSLKQEHNAGHYKSFCFPPHLIMEQCLRHSPAGPSLHSHADVSHNAVAECVCDVLILNIHNTSV